MTYKPLSIAVVGHTNAGKTSLLRALTRNKIFGDVSRRNSTTKDVSFTHVNINGEPRLKLFDTPGFEDSNDFREYIRQFEVSKSRKATLESFLASPEAIGAYEQQAKVVRNILSEIDLVFYVIDSTEEPLPKYLAELDVLAMSGRPVLPILNFVSSEQSNSVLWRETLADRGLHVKVSYDAVTPKQGSEYNLYRHLGKLLEDREKEVENIISGLALESRNRLHAGLSTIAELLVDAAAYRVEVKLDDTDMQIYHATQMKEHLRLEEQKCVDNLLKIFGFDRNDLKDVELSVINEKAEDDLFDPEAFREASTRLGVGAVIGSAIGLGIDIALVGGSLGLGLVLGGAIGGAISGYAKELYRWARAKIQGLAPLIFDETTLAILLNRQLKLIEELQRRSHAAVIAIERDTGFYKSDAWIEITKAISKIRIHPEWSGITPTPEFTLERDEVIKRLVEIIQKHQQFDAHPLLST